VGAINPRISRGLYGIGDATLYRDIGVYWGPGAIGRAFAGRPGSFAVGVGPPRDYPVITNGKYRHFRGLIKINYLIDISMVQAKGLEPLTP
jgi:hypothetical protein